MLAHQSSRRGLVIFYSQNKNELTAAELVLGRGPDNGRVRQKERRPPRTGVRFSADGKDVLTAGAVVVT
jgi:hypothetical protein